MRDGGTEWLLDGVPFSTVVLQDLGVGLSGLVGISDAAALGFVLLPAVHRRLLILRSEDEVLKASLKRTPPSLPPEQEEERISISNPKHKGWIATKTDVRHQS